MKHDEALSKIPAEGFIKLYRDSAPQISSSQRTALVRKGNELFNAGRIEQAKRVFITARYGDGLSRVGDVYFEQNRTLDALRMYWLAPAPDKVEKLIEKISSVVQTWMAEEEGTYEEGRSDQHTSQS